MFYKVLKHGCSLTDDGQIELTHSISAGLDYAAVGPEHAYLQDIGRTEYTYATDDEALAAFKQLAEVEGDTSGSREFTRSGVCGKSSG